MITYLLTLCALLVAIHLIMSAIETRNPRSRSVITLAFVVGVLAAAATGALPAVLSGSAAKWGGVSTVLLALSASGHFFYRFAKTAHSADVSPDSD
jgi:hypothetical protein